MNKLPAFLLLPALFFLTGCGGGAPKPAATADAAVMQVVDSLKSNQPEGFWNMLPASYQTQANEVLHDFANKMPPAMYDQGAGLLVKLEKVLTTKKDLILANPMLEQVPVDVSANYDHVVAMLSAVTSSDLMSVDKLKSADIGSLMSSIGGEMMEAASKIEVDQSAATGDMQEALEFKKKLDSVKAELVSEEGDTAVVRITAEGEDPEEVEFVKVEGKWIPTELAEGWSEMITEAQAGVAEINITPEMASQAQMMMGMAGGVLDQLQQAQTQEELQQIIGGLMGMMMGGM
jgi:hypothetical protein